MENVMDNARRIEAALALVRQEPLQPEPETFELSCICALNENPYTLRFTRQKNGRFRWTESVKVFRDDKASRSFGYVPPAITVKLDEIEVTPLPCAWCGNGRLNYCQSGCNSFVCGALMRGNTHHCRKSCGRSWATTPLKELQGSVPSPTAWPMVGSEPTGPSTSAAPDRLQLGAGSTLAKRGSR